MLSLLIAGRYTSLPLKLTKIFDTLIIMVQAAEIDAQSRPQISCNA
jgi:hypothetical protein